MVRTTAAPKVGVGTKIHRLYPVDRAHLARQTLGDKGLELEVLRMFDDTARTYFGRIESSTSIEELLRHLHTLKGAAAGVGAVGIAELAALAESELKAGQPVNPERIDDLEMAVVECSTWIEGVLTEAGA
jgi:HPt (histidine-containing phosphotransfer) domain-containing protein